MNIDNNSLIRGVMHILSFIGSFIGQCSPEQRINLGLERIERSLGRLKGTREEKLKKVAKIWSRLEALLQSDKAHDAIFMSVDRISRIARALDKIEHPEKKDASQRLVKLFDRVLQSKA